MSLLPFIKVISHFPSPFLFSLSFLAYFVFLDKKWAFLISSHVPRIWSTVELQSSQLLPQKGRGHGAVQGQQELIEAQS